MNTLYQRLAGESISDALLRLEADIKARPADADLRAAFVQFLILSGNWARALTQLKSWLALKPQAKPTVTLLEQAIQGEQPRVRGRGTTGNARGAVAVADDVSPGADRKRRASANAAPGGTRTGPGKPRAGHAGE